MTEQEIKLLGEQVRQAAVDCYASEGYFPQSVNHLVEHYGLVYDQERYLVRYDAPHPLMSGVDIAWHTADLPLQFRIVPHPELEELSKT